MNPTVVQLLVLAIFFALVLSEMPIALSLGIAGFAGIVMLDGFVQAQNALSSILYSSAAKYGLVVIPMFVLLGSLVGRSGIGREIFGATNRLIGRVPGGLAATTVMATTIFSGISGSSAADVATFGRIAVTEMKGHGYPGPYAAAIVAAAGTFAVLVPPSIGLVIYAILAEESVGAMLLAGVIPGAISAVILISYIVFRARRDGIGSNAQPEIAPESVDINRSGTIRTLLRDYRGLGYAVLLFAIVVGGIYAGLFTATEAAAVGAFAALIIAVVLRRPEGGESRMQALRESLRETVQVSSMIFLLLIGGGILAYFVTTARIPNQVTGWVATLPIDPWMVVALFVIVVIPLGMFLDGLSILLIVVPVAAPIVVELGFSGIWFGVLMLKAVEVGLITPPVGINIFIVCGLVDGIRVEDAFRSVLPFVALDLAVTALFFSLPVLSTWLPELAGLI